MNDAAFYFKVPDCFILVYKPSASDQIHQDDLKAINEWVLTRHQKRQEWSLLIMFDFLKITDYQSKKTRQVFEKLKQSILQSIAKSLPQLDQQKLLSFKIHKLIICTELGSDEALIQLLSLHKDLSLPSQGMERQMSELKQDITQGLIDLIQDVRFCIAVNLDIKLDYYTQQQTYQHMQVLTSSTQPIKQQEAELCRYLNLMIAKVLLHIRLGQAGHVYDIFVSLFDIVNDTSLIGVKQIPVNPNWKKPELFTFKEDKIVQQFKLQVYDEIKIRQILFWLVQNSYLCIRTNDLSQWLENMLKFWYKFVREVTQMFRTQPIYQSIQTPWLFSCLQQMVDRVSTLPGFVEIVADKETSQTAQAVRIRKFAEALIFRYLDEAENLFNQQHDLQQTILDDVLAQIFVKEKEISTEFISTQFQQQKLKLEQWGSHPRIISLLEHKLNRIIPEASWSDNVIFRCSNALQEYNKNSDSFNALICLKYMPIQTCKKFFPTFKQDLFKQEYHTFTHQVIDIFLAKKLSKLGKLIPTESGFAFQSKHLKTIFIQPTFKPENTMVTLKDLKLDTAVKLKLNVWNKIEFNIVKHQLWFQQLQLRISGDGHNFEVELQQPDKFIYKKKMPLVVTALICCSCNEGNQGETNLFRQVIHQTYAYIILLGLNPFVMKNTVQLLSCLNATNSQKVGTSRQSKLTSKQQRK